ncbi:MAG: RsmD family RNA methyltransferase [Mucinivorans sp.]
MRIVAGTHKHRTITPPTNLRARPTTDFAKENIFNVISNAWDMEGIAVLDLFSGTGSISYEFASRGAARVVSIELNPTHHSFIQQTAAQLKLDMVQAVCTNAFVYLRSIKNTHFDIIFADPPYAMEGVETLPEIVLTSEILVDGGWFILEHSADKDFSAVDKFIEMRHWGSVHFSIFEK